MWKDIFYFSRGQRAGIIILLVIIALAIATDLSMPYFFPSQPQNPDGFLKEAEAFRKTLIDRDSLMRVTRQKLYEEKCNTSYPDHYSAKDPVYSLFRFDPNTTDSAGFVHLGLKPFIASNILKYRNKGGRFRTVADFSKVYGILPEKFKELEPFITIKEISAKRDSIIKKSETKKDIIVELNSADTALLMQVKGIGRGYAKGIVRFRRAMGGFVSVNQLSELYGMTPENFEKMRPFCTVNPNLVQRINVNVASAEKLNAHPYINFYQAKSLYELRRYKGRLKGIEDLSKLSEFTKEDLERIRPYLSFE